MKKQFRSSIILLVSMGILSFIFACTGNRTKESKNDVNMSSDLEEDPQAIKFPAKLDILWVDRESVLKLPTSPDTAKHKERRLVLKYYLLDSKTLTFHGWSGRGKSATDSNVDDTFEGPQLVFNNGPKSTVKIGNKTYFGNYVISKKL